MTTKTRSTGWIEKSGKRISMDTFVDDNGRVVGRYTSSVVAIYKGIKIYRSKWTGLYSNREGPRGKKPQTHYGFLGSDIQYKTIAAARNGIDAKLPTVVKKGYARSKHKRAGRHRKIG